MPSNLEAIVGRKQHPQHQHLKIVPVKPSRMFLRLMQTPLTVEELSAICAAMGKSPELVRLVRNEFKIFDRSWRRGWSGHRYKNPERAVPAYMTAMAVYRLQDMGFSAGRIARELGIGEGYVRRHLSGRSEAAPHVTAVMDIIEPKVKHEVPYIIS